MTTVGVLVGAVAVLAFVFYWSGRYGGRARGGTSLRRGPGAHTTSKGRPKVAYATREQAEAQDQRLGCDQKQRKNQAGDGDGYHAASTTKYIVIARRRRRRGGQLHHAGVSASISIA